MLAIYVPYICLCFFFFGVLHVCNCGVATSLEWSSLTCSRALHVDTLHCMVLMSGGVALILNGPSGEVLGPCWAGACVLLYDVAAIGGEFYIRRLQ